MKVNKAIIPAAGLGSNQKKSSVSLHPFSGSTPGV